MSGELPDYKKQALGAGIDIPMAEGSNAAAAAAVEGVLAGSPSSLSMPVGSVPASASAAGTSPVTLPARSASSFCLQAPGPNAGAGAGMVKSLSELRLASSVAANRPSLHIPALNQSMQWAESASNTKAGDTGASTSDEGPTSTAIIKHRLRH